MLTHCKREQKNVRNFLNRALQKVKTRKNSDNLYIENKEQIVSSSIELSQHQKQIFWQPVHTAQLPENKNLETNQKETKDNTQLQTTRFKFSS